MLVPYYTKLTETPDGFESFGAALIRDGLCVITDTPDRYVCAELNEKVGLYLSQTHYGYDIHAHNGDSIPVC